MNCPYCESENGDYGEWWDEYLDENGWKEAYLDVWWDCFTCKTRTMSYEDGFEYED